MPRKPWKVTPAVRDEVIRLRSLDRLTIEKVAERLGLSVRTVGRVCREETAKRRLQSLRAGGIPPAERDRIIELYQQGKLLKLIAHETGRPQGTVSVVVSEAIRAGKVQSRYKSVDENERSPEWIAAIAQDYRNGIPTAQLAEKYGRPVPTICRWLAPLFASGELLKRKPRRKKRPHTRASAERLHRDVEA